MAERFLKTFEVTGGPAIADGSSFETVEKLLKSAGGRTFDFGLYRIHTHTSARAADVLVRDAFPELAGRLVSFGYDWLGRQFATDNLRGKEDPEVLMLEPGTGEALEIPVPFSRFHDEELVDHGEEALARAFFRKWRASGGESPNLSECIGYQRPLFLGGLDVLSNLELVDQDVYWAITGQLRRQARGLSAGTRIIGVQSNPQV